MQVAVVLVDDDPMVLQVNRQYVAAVPGFAVVGTARTGAEAVAAVARLRPDLVLLDIYLPDMDGIAALKEIRRLELPTDVILISAAQDAHTIREALRYGAVDYIIKPFRQERLAAALVAYRQMWLALRRGAPLSQEQVDRMLRAGQGAAGGEGLPKGLQEFTLRQVTLALARAGRPLTAAEVGEAAGLSRVTARRYLEYLAQLGKVEVEVQYGGVGRPQHVYRLLGSGASP